MSQIKEFGQKEFGLPKTRNFTRANFNIENLYFVYWCSGDSFCEKPFYLKESKLFYSKEDAVDFCRSVLSSEKFDYYICKMRGSFIDQKNYKGSLLTLCHLEISHFILASSIFHEDFHFWIAENNLVSIGRSDEEGALEESIADLFGGLGAIVWLRRTGSDKNLIKYSIRNINSTIKNALALNSEYKSLIKIYKNSKLSKEQRQALKKYFFKKNRKLVGMSSGAVGGVANNASFYTARLYSKYLPLFYSFCQCYTSINNPDLRLILEKLKEISKKSKSQKDFIRRMQNSVNSLLGRNKK
ncbi:MAG: hypothetical protein AAB824_00500 [Patescibacteria group bacterium]